MAIAVITKASGGLPVKDLGGPGGMAVTEVAPALGGIAVTKVAGAGGGLGVTFVSATGGPAVTYATFDGTPTNVTLSNGNLTATHSSAATNSGARSTAQKNSGKYYFEFTCTTILGPDVLGIVKAAGTYTNVVQSATEGVYVLGTGAIWASNASSGFTIGSIVNGEVVGIAVDLENEKAWLRKAPSGNWNGQAIGSQNPANATGGAIFTVLSATTVAPVVGFSAGTNQSVIANFGASAFVGAVPSGFTAGWPA